MSTIHEERRDAVSAMMARVRDIEARLGVTPAAIDAIKVELTGLASREGLFPPEHFPVKSGHGSIYRIAEDADGRFALYGSAGVPGKAQPPHNHTTWAAISGVRGEEHNVCYRRSDNRSIPGQGKLERTGALTVRKGNAIGFLPDDFHTIEVTGTEPSLHLHLYGLSLERLPERIFFGDSAGGAYTVFPAPPKISPCLVTPAELKAMLKDGEELALLDVREEGAFAASHLFHAVPLPLSRLEVMAEPLVPRKGTRIVLIDAGDGALARRAAERLVRLGYRDISSLDGGVEGWKEAGYELFSGVNVPSKAFGEFVEHHDGTPRIEAATLKAMIDAGEKLVILDSRPFVEFRAMSIPGGLDCPGAELVRRAFDAAPSPDTTIVVNCAGRTRSIIGAQSLINAGLPNRVVALKNGTMGWELAGYQVAKGATARAPEPSAAGRVKAEKAVAAIVRRYGISRIDRSALERFRSESDRRTLYLLDVRLPEAYAAGHLPGARSAPGGQLVQATDQYVGTRNARLVLVDEDGIAASMTAHWLVQLGWPEVHVLTGAMKPGVALESGPDRTPPSLDLPEVPALDVDALARETAAGGVTVLDLDTSIRYRKGHVPGAVWANRARFDTSLAKLPAARLIVVAAPDEPIARLAAAEVAAATGKAVAFLKGGTLAWMQAGKPVEKGHTNLIDTADDVWVRPYDHEADQRKHMQAYLDWEVGLVEQVERDGDAGFKRFA